MLYEQIGGPGYVGVLKWTLLGSLTFYCYNVCYVLMGQNNDF